MGTWRWGPAMRWSSCDIMAVRSSTPPSCGKVNVDACCACGVCAAQETQSISDDDSELRCDQVASKVHVLWQRESRRLLRLRRLGSAADAGPSARESHEEIFVLWLAYLGQVEVRSVDSSATHA